MGDGQRPGESSAETGETERGELMFTGPWACLFGAAFFVLVGVWWYLSDVPPNSLFGTWGGVAIAVVGSIMMIYEFFKKRGWRP